MPFFSKIFQIFKLGFFSRQLAILKEFFLAFRKEPYFNPKFSQHGQKGKLYNAVIIM